MRSHQILPNISAKFDDNLFRFEFWPISIRSDRKEVEIIWIMRPNEIFWQKT